MVSVRLIINCCCLCLVFFFAFFLLARIGVSSWVQYKVGIQVHNIKLLSFVIDERQFQIRINYFLYSKGQFERTHRVSNIKEVGKKKDSQKSIFYLFFMNFWLLGMFIQGIYIRQCACVCIVTVVLVRVQKLPRCGYLILFILLFFFSGTNFKAQTVMPQAGGVGSSFCLIVVVVCWDFYGMLSWDFVPSGSIDNRMKYWFYNIWQLCHV
jgi:hypothetical protein